METTNPTQPVQPVQAFDPATGQPIQQPVQTVVNPAQQVVAEPVQAQPVIAVTNPVYKMPVARAGQELAQPMAIKANLLRASSRIVTDPATNQTAELIILEFEGFPTAVVRTMKQAQGDLIEYYTRDQLLAMSATLATASYNRYFKGRPVNMVASYHEVGAINTVNENSSLYKAGLQALGAKVATTTDGIWIEGFLNAEQTQAELDAIIDRELKAISDMAKANAGLL